MGASWSETNSEEASNPSPLSSQAVSSAVHVHVDAEEPVSSSGLFEDSSNLDTGLRCCICEANAVDPCVAIACRHVYCRQCIVNYLLSRGTRLEQICPACLTPVSVYQIVVINSRKLLRERDISTIYGSTYRSSPASAFGDLYFSADECYMRNKSLIDETKILFFDDGAEVPARIHFENWYYNSSSRVFEGTLDFGTQHYFRKASKLRMKLKFLDSFDAVEEGEIKRFDREGNEMVPYVIERDSILRWQRIKKSIYDNDSIYYLELQVPWLMEQIAGFVALFARWYYGISIEPVIETIRSRIPAESIGLGSFHFSRSGSYVDFSRSTQLLAQGMPRYVRFMHENFDPISRIFEGAVEMPLENGPLFIVHYHLVFDASLSKIVDGEHKFYQVLRPILSGDVLTQKYSNIAQGQLYLLEEKHYGFGPDDILRFRAMCPWQDIVPPPPPPSRSDPAPTETPQSGGATDAS